MGFIMSSDIKIEPRLYGAELAAGYLGISRAYIYKLVDKGILLPIYIGTRVLFPKEYLDEFVDKLKQNRGK
jgi:excisionase family DNA binding protein